MKIQFNQNLKDPYAREIKLNENDKEQSITLGRIAYDALLANLENDNDNKYELYKLAKLTIEDEVDLSVEQIAKIKERIEKVWSTLIVGAAFDVIEKVN